MMKNLLTFLIAILFTTTAFSQVSSIGIIGTGSPNMNWDEDVDMTQDQTDTAVWTMNVDLVLGVVKFRANDDWALNWGATDFPMGTGEPGGDNIPVVGGNYDVTFNHVTGEYNFESTSPLYNTIGIIGTAVNGGWDDDIDMEQNPTNPNLWSIGSIDLMDGEAKFRAEDAWDINWGSADFPTGTGTQGGDNIAVTAGTYKVLFNSATGEYSFENPISIFNTIGVIGDATGNGWDSDIDMNQDAVNADDWNIELGLVTGGMKFRAEDDWADNWGAPMFPVGNGTPGGDNIPVLEGDWAIAFNATSGFYTFTPVSIGLIGDALAGGWDADEDLSARGTMGNTWEGTFTAVQDGAVKFRKDDDWASNWGAVDFPMGTGSQDGDNIPITAGDWMVTFNSVTGEYSFSPASSTNNILSASLVNIFPNPATDELNIQIQAEQMQGAVEVTVFDLNGRALTTSAQNASNTISENISSLSNGIYLLQVRNERYVVNKRFSVAK